MQSDGVVRRFMHHVDAQYAAAQKVSANSKAEIAEYKKGQQIEAISGPFAEMLITFNRVVKQQHDAYPRIEGMVSMLGGQVPVLFDPLDVRQLDIGLVHNLNIWYAYGNSHQHSLRVGMSRGRKRLQAGPVRKQF